MGELDDRVAAYTAGIRSVMDSLKRELRGTPLHVAEQRLISGLRERDIFLPRPEVRVLAQQLSDPWWPLKHPLRARDWLRHEDPEAKAAETEVEIVRERIERIIEAQGAGPAWSFGARRTFDGWRYELELRPHSDRIAEVVRRKLAPISIEIRGHGRPD